MRMKNNINCTITLITNEKAHASAVATQPLLTKKVPPRLATGVLPIKAMEKAA